MTNAVLPVNCFTFMRLFASFSLFEVFPYEYDPGTIRYNLYGQSFSGDDGSGG
jgi:hypothetical protein